MVVGALAALVAAVDQSGGLRDDVTILVVEDGSGHGGARPAPAGPRP